MKENYKSAFGDMIFVPLKGEDWLSKQRIAGKVVAETLTMLENLVKEKTTKSLSQLSDIAEEFILKNNCTPTFKNYKKFPAAVCISVNKQLVHGIPTDYKLQEGDVVSFDLGATFEGAIADSAITCIYGEPIDESHVKMIAACKEALMKGILAIKAGLRIGVIGDAVHRSAKGNGFKVVENYGGHSISWNTPHAAPFISNRALPEEGIRIQKGFTCAIEPMLVANDLHNWVDRDGWTVYGREISCHEEHTIYVHEDRVEVITQR